MHIRGSLGPDPSLVVREIMKATGSTLSIQLKETKDEPEVELGVNEWKMVLKPGTQEPSGRIRIRMGSTGAARELEEVIHGCPIKIGGCTATIEVSNPVLHKTLSQCLGNHN